MGFPVTAFAEQSFLADLRAAIRASSDFSWIDDAQVFVFDREPDESEPVILEPPSMLLLGNSFEVEQGLGGVSWLVYPVRAILIAETLDASDDEDRWTDATEGGAKLRQLFLDGLARLGPNGDGTFTLTAGGSIDYIDPAIATAPLRLRIEDGGRDLSCPEYNVNFHIHY